MPCHRLASTRPQAGFLLTETDSVFFSGGSSWGSPNRLGDGSLVPVSAIVLAHVEALVCVCGREQKSQLALSRQSTSEPDALLLLAAELNQRIGRGVGREEKAKAAEMSTWKDSDWPLAPCCAGEESGLGIAGFSFLVNTVGVPYCSLGR